MKVTPTEFTDVLLLEPRVFRDERGYFFESFNRGAFCAAIGMSVEFVQDNHSCSARGVVRGLHFQNDPHAQGKLVRVTRGRAFDVVVDIRRTSPHFGRWAAVELSADNFRQLWIPPGFAHGFLALEDGTELLYKTTDFYAKDAEGCVLWNDPAIGIRWPLPEGVEPRLSPKDAVAPGISALR